MTQTCKTGPCSSWLRTWKLFCFGNVTKSLGSSVKNRHILKAKKYLFNTCYQAACVVL